jgi:hypothetical protein
MKIFIKKHSKKILITVICCVVIWQLFNIILSIGGNKVYPKEDVRINDSVCLRFVSNLGSGEHVNLYSYYCNTKPNWNVIYEIGSDYKWVGSGILDRTSTTECPIIKIQFDKQKQKNLINIKQDRLCKFFSHDYPDPLLEILEVDNNGKFKEVYKK